MRYYLWLTLLGLFGWAIGVYGLPASAANTPTQRTIMVPMRDGVHLATDVHLPAGDGPWAVALTRTPYGRSDGGSITARVSISGLVGKGIAVVSQDVRGRFDSEGLALPLADEGWGKRQDGLDTVNWIRQQPWCNGKIATFGSSYQAINQFLLAGAGPEGIVGQHITVGAGDVYHYFYFQQGVWRKGLGEGWLLMEGYPADALAQIWEHPRYDSFWGTMDFSTRVEQVHWPAVLVSGWFDRRAFAQGTLDAFTQIQDRGGVGSRPHLVMGPWTHPGAAGYSPRDAGELHFPTNANYPPGAPTDLQWLSFWLTGKPEIPADEPAVRYYVMGDTKDPKAPGNVWRTADRWPPPSQPLRLYFTADGGLVSQPPSTVTTREYDYEPLNPVFTLEEATPLNWEGGDGSRDQQRVENRPDVLLFTTPPLTEPLEVTGRLSVRLYASTSARDTDFTAKLTDVYPDGRSMLLTNGIVRARYRQSVAKATPVQPGEHYAFDIDLSSTSIVFNRGHQIRVAISSSNYPRFELNRNNGHDWPDDQFFPSQVAHQTIFLGGAEASYVTLPEVVGSGTP
jgi:predicted acyl esterase